MMDKNSGESGYRAKIILLKYEGYTVPEIKRAINHHDINIRKWIHRFNEKGIGGIISKIYIHKPVRITDDIEKKIIEIATKNPRKEYGLPFSTWSLRGLAGYVSKEYVSKEQPDRFYKSNRNKKHLSKVWNKV